MYTTYTATITRQQRQIADLERAYAALLAAEAQSANLARALLEALQVLDTAQAEAILTVFPPTRVIETKRR